MGQGRIPPDGTNFATALGTYMAGNGQRFTCAAVYNRSGDLSADLVMLDGSANPKVTMWGAIMDLSCDRRRDQRICSEWCWRRLVLDPRG